MHQSLNYLRGPSLDSPVAPCPSCTGEPRTGHSTPGVASPGLSRGGGSPPLTCWQHSSECTPGYRWPSWPQGHIAESWSASCLPGLPCPSLQSCSPARQPPINKSAVKTDVFCKRFYLVGNPPFWENIGIPNFQLALSTVTQQTV